MGRFAHADDTAFLGRVLEGRLEKILERYLLRLSPIADVHVTGDAVCGVDLAEWRQLRRSDDFRFVAQRVGGARLEVLRLAGGGLCVLVPHTARAGGSADDDPSRYVRVAIKDGVARGLLIAHLYDLGAGRGYALAGLERPDREEP
jgi:hypothetical protein